MKLTSYNNLFFLEYPDALTVAVERGELQADAMMQLADEARAAMDELEQEWPSERIKEELLKEQRRRCEWSKNKIQQLELENKDARQRGVSYKERMLYTRQIEVLKKMFTDDRAKGIAFSKKSFTVKDFAKVGDLEFIHSRGFDQFLKYATI